MKKPSNYDSTEVFSAWEQLETGGHYLTILGAKEAQSKSGRDMLVIQFDTAKGDKQPSYFTNNHREGFYYQGTHYIILGDEDWAVRNLKSLITAVEESNYGFKFDWANPNCLKGQNVGGVFGEEEYLNDRNEVRKSVKLRWFCSVSSVEGASIPKPKTLDIQDTKAPESDGLPFDL